MSIDVRSVLCKSQNGADIHKLQRPAERGVHHVSRHTRVDLNNIAPVCADECALARNQVTAGVISLDDVPRQNLFRERQRPRDVDAARLRLTTLSARAHKGVAPHA